MSITTTDTVDPNYPPAKARRFGTWTYLVSFVAPGGVAGTAVTTRPCPIDDENEVLNVRAWVRAGGTDRAVITNIVLLKRRRFARYKPGSTSVTRHSDPVLNY